MQKGLSTYAIAATYVGTIVGAGFASGQEVLLFFGYFGSWGLLGIVLAAALFIFFGFLVLKLGYILQAHSHLPVIEAIGSRWISKIIDAIITFFLFGTVLTMAAGSGAIFAEQFNLSAIWGSLLLIIAAFLTVLLGITQVIRSISFFTPILLIFVFLLGFGTVFSDFGGFIKNLSWSDPSASGMFSWLPAAILYVSYNLVLAIAVLAPLGALSRPEKLFSGAFLGGLCLGISLIAIVSAILTKAPQITEMEVPMIAVAASLSPLMRNAYGIILFAEVYTTAVAGLYGFTSRLAAPNSTDYRRLAITASFAAFIFAQFGFSNIVRTLFPAVGLAGLLLLASLTFSYFKNLK